MSRLEGLIERMPVLERLPFVPSFRKITREEYLATLSFEDRKAVQGFVSFFEQRRSYFSESRVGIIAFGSSAKPEHLRNHPMEDIDLRVTTSAPPNSEHQASDIKLATSVAESFAKIEGYQFETIPECTTHRTLVQGFSDSGPETITWLDYSNNDPSVVIQIPKGHPVHVSISGPGEQTLDKHLKEERRQRQYHSVLSIFSGNNY